MYRQDSFREGLLYEQCAELVAMEERLAEVDGLLSGVRVVRTSACACGAPLSPTSRFCANCGRPAGQRTVAACRSCGHALAADARFCPVCGTPAGDDSDVALGAGDT
ncbi:MAG: zinc ribbon domain-containing protein, partial [Actinobacteria bacterium]|nr:zinc ribbon domain-containing protein [Actinomycetota bacterium]